MSQINKTIANRYVLKETIGQGGMADVYLADDKILEREVAVKIMRSSLTGDPVYVTRFHREASAAASLSHKNIVEIYDVGEENDDYYIVMEYVPGQTLKELLHKRGALHYVEAIDIMKQVTSATAKAHAMGIIHRDLKPQNIMVTDSGVVKIGDFGIASIQSLSQVTQTDTIMGSLHYLSPEIARGEKASKQSDIYALGIVFYELLRGEVPFNGESPVNIALKHMRDEIPSVRDFNESIPQSVENIIIKATAKNLNDRYETADEMMHDLQTCLQRENEEKLVFAYDETADEATIIAEDKEFFTQTMSQKVVDDDSVIKEKPTEKKPMDKKKIAIIAGSIVGVIALCAIVYFAFLKPSDNFRMPNIANMKEEEAIELLEDKGLVVDEFVRRELSDSIDAGLVIKSDPDSGETVKKGDVVSLVVSSGKYIVIDDYVGKSYDDVYKSLTEQGLTVNKEEKVDEASKGTILSQSMSKGEKIDPNGSNKTITLTVSKGYSVEVNNVLGLDIYKAKFILEGNGFVVELKEKTPPTTAQEINAMKLNVVLEQSIAPLTTVYKKGEKITLYYYKTKPEVPTPEPTQPEETTPDDNTQGASEN